MNPTIVFDVQQKHFDNHQGGNVGGVPPKKVTLDQSSKKPSALFTIEGNTVPGKIPMVDWYTTLPIVLAATRLTLAYDVTFDAKLATDCWAQERDLKLTFNKRTANFSFERVVGQNGNLQVSANGSGGNWKDIGFALPTLIPGVPHHFVHRFAFDFTKFLYSYLAINIDGQEFTIPMTSDFQNQAFDHGGWGDGALFQFQQDARPDLQDPSFTETLDRCTLTFF